MPKANCGPVALDLALFSGGYLHSFYDFKSKLLNEQGKLYHFEFTVFSKLVYSDSSIKNINLF